MKRGIIKIEKEFLHDLLRLPQDCVIESVNSAGLTVEFVLVGPDMPDDSNGMQDVEVIVHRQETYVEFKIHKPPMNGLEHLRAVSDALSDAPF